MPLSIGIGISPTKISDAVSALFSGIPTPTWALDFARDQYSTLSPALTVSSPTGGVMVPDYLGNYHLALAGEIPIRGGRRVENLFDSSPSDWQVFASGSVTIGAADANGWCSISNADRSGIAYHYAGESITTNNGTSTLSVDVEYVAGSGWVWLLGEGSTDRFAFFNVLTGAKGSSTGFDLTSITALDGGGYRISATITKSSGTKVDDYALGLAVADGTPNWDSSGAAGQEQVKARRGQFVVHRPGQTEPDPEYVSRGVLSSPYHGYGVDGLAWMRTDPSGLALADAASGYPVLCTGIANWPTLTNWVLQNQDAASWTVRGGPTTTIADADDGTVEGGYFEVRGLGDINSNDVYKVATGFTADANVGLALLLRPVDTTGTLRIVNPADANKGNWALDVSTLTSGEWNLVNRSHPGVTVTSEFTANVEGVAGVQLYRGATMTDIDMAVATQIDGTLYCPVVIPTASLAVSVTKILKTPSPAAIGLTAGLGTFVIEHTPELPADVEASNQYLLSLVGPAGDAAFLYNWGGEVGAFVFDDGVVQWSSGSADAAWVAGETQRVAWRMEDNDGSIVADGVERVTDTSMTVPSVSTIYLGGDAGSKYAGSIGAFVYYAAGA